MIRTYTFISPYSRWSELTIYRLLVGLALIFSLDQCKQPSVPAPANTTPTRDDNMAKGNPDGAEPSAFSPNTYLITRFT